VGIEESEDAQVVTIQKILDFLGDYDENDMSLLVLEEFLLLVENNHVLISLHMNNLTLNQH
jgi:hypothetical protein